MSKNISFTSKRTLAQQISGCSLDFDESPFRSRDTINQERLYRMQQQSPLNSAFSRSNLPTVSTEGKIRRNHGLDAGTREKM